MMNLLRKDPSQPINKEGLLNVIWWGLAIGLVIGSWINAMRGISSYDWFVFYSTQAEVINKQELFNPMWIYLILKPISLLPGVFFSFLVLLLLTIVMYWTGAKLVGGNRLWLLLSFPAFWVIWYGQLDGFLLFGVALGYWALERKKHFVVGLAIMLILVKPHIGWPLAIAMLYWSRNWKVIIVPIFVFGSSLILFGVDWPLVWVQNMYDAFFSGVRFTTQATNISLFPYGLIAWLVLLVKMPRRDKIIVILSAAMLSSPYAPVYTLLALLVFPVPWWAYVASSFPYLSGPMGYGLTVIAPIGLLIWVIWLSFNMNSRNIYQMLIWNKSATPSRINPQ